MIHLITLTISNKYNQTSLVTLQSSYFHVCFFFADSKILSRIRRRRPFLPKRLKSVSPVPCPESLTLEKRPPELMRLESPWSLLLLASARLRLLDRGPESQLLLLLFDQPFNRLLQLLEALPQYVGLNVGNNVGARVG